MVEEGRVWRRLACATHIRSCKQREHAIQEMLPFSATLFLFCYAAGRGPDVMHTIPRGAERCLSNAVRDTWANSTSKMYRTKCTMSFRELVCLSTSVKIPSSSSVYLKRLRVRLNLDFRVAKLEYTLRRVIFKTQKPVHRRQSKYHTVSRERYFIMVLERMYVLPFLMKRELVCFYA